MQYTQFTFFIDDFLYQLYVTIDPKGSDIMNQTSDKGLIESGHFLPETSNLRKSFIISASKRSRRIERHTLR